MDAAELIVRDAFGFLEEDPGQFDVIISDTTDPIGMAERLFSDEFYKRMVRALTPGGAASTQCEQPFFDTALIQKIYASPEIAHQKSRILICAHQPTLAAGLVLCMCPMHRATDGLKTAYPPGLNNYLNPEVHTAAFALPDFFRRELYS